MRRFLPACAVLGALFLAVGGHIVYYYPRLPARVASHFGPDGRPDGWSSKETLVASYAATAYGMGGIMALIGLSMRWMPPWMVNLPNKKYWFAPERRRETSDTICGFLLWLTAATVLFLMGVMHCVFVANLCNKPELGPGFPWLLGAYLSLVAVWSIWLLWRFRKPSVRPGDVR